MKKLAMTALAAVTMMLTVVPEGETAASARMAWTRNTVQMTRGGRWVRARSGSLLNSGSYVRTGRGARAQIRYSDGSVVRLGSRSVARIRYSRRKNVNLRRGKAYFKVKKQRRRMRVRTRRSVATVLGTEFLLVAGEPETQQSLNQGPQLGQTQLAQGAGGVDQLIVLEGAVGFSPADGFDPNSNFNPANFTTVTGGQQATMGNNGNIDINTIDPDAIKQQEGLTQDDQEANNPNSNRRFANRRLSPDNPNAQTQVNQNSPDNDRGTLSTSPVTGELIITIK